MLKHGTAHEWLQAGRASELSSSISDAFDDHVSSLPWNGTTALDWSRMPFSSTLNLVGRSPEEVYRWAGTTRLGHHRHMAVWYSRNEGGIIVPLRECLTALDELYWDAPGPRFAFGVKIVGDGRAAFLRGHSPIRMRGCARGNSCAMATS
jgi:hypothetical protein